MENNPSIKKFRKSHRHPVLVQIYQEYCNNSTIHGVKYLGEKRRPLLERLFWICVFVLSIYLCSKLINNIWNKWQETPVIVSFSEKSTPVWGIPFPAITICPETKSQQEIVKFSNLYRILGEHISQYGRTVEIPENITEKNFEYMRALLQVCGNHLVEDVHFSSYETIDFLEKLDEVAPIFNLTYPFCKWRNSIGTCEKHFAKSYTEEGVCYTFNGLSATELYREMTFQFQYNSSFTGQSTRSGLKWSLQDGYDVNDRVETYPERVLGAGARAGIFMALQGFEQDMDYICRGPVQGFKVLLHSPEDVPQVSKQYLRVPFKKEILISVKPNMIITSEGIKDYHPSRRQCFFNKERYLKNFKIYTQNNCELECLANHTLDKCGCVKFSMPRTPDIPVCDISKIQCYDEAEDELLKNEFTEGLKGSGLNVRGKTKCNCLPACTSLVYNTEISQADFDLNSLLRAYNDSYLEENPGVQMSRLSIFFKENQFITSKRSELYGMTDFLANCGGLFGLFMGISFLSLIELCYHCSLRLWSNVQYVKKYKNNIDIKNSKIEIISKPEL